MFNSDDSRHSRNRNNLSLTALFAILLGAVFLLNNFGILPWEIWQNAWKFWPVLLILFGVETVLGRHSSPKGFGFLLFLIFALPLILILNPLSGNILATSKITVDKPLGNLTKVQLDFNFASASIKLNSLETNSTKVLQGEIKYSSILPKPEIVEESKFGESKFSFSQASKSVPFLNNIGNRVDLRISRLIPYDIFVKSNTGNLDFNFRDVKVDFLNIEAGAGKFNFEFSKKYSSKVFVNSSATLLFFKIPSEVGVSLKVPSRIKQLDISSSRFAKEGQLYRSRNFQTSNNKIEIEVSGVLSKVEIKP